MPTNHYVRPQIDNVITVRSIISLYRIDLRRKPSSGDVHDFPEIFYVEEGHQSTNIDGIHYHLNAGQMIMYAPNAYHGPVLPNQLAFGGGSVCIVGFEADWGIDTLYNRVFTLTSHQRELYSDIITKGLELFKTEWGGGHINNLPRNEEFSRGVQYIKNMLELFLLDLYSYNSSVKAQLIGSNKEKLKADQMRELTEYFLDRLDRTLTLEQISRDLGFSVSKLRRLVFEQKGCGPIAYFIDLKIEEAKRLIRKTSLNITEISEHLGFSSLHYFSKQFKNKTGISPSTYAKNIDKR